VWTEEDAGAFLGDNDKPILVPVGNLYREVMGLKLKFQVAIEYRILNATLKILNLTY
jgi:hypothetical protein